MQRSVRNISGLFGMAALTVCVIVMISTTGCSQQPPPSPLTSGTPAQVDHAMQQSAQNYAAYRQAHPAGAPGAGQATPGTGQ